MLNISLNSVNDKIDRNKYNVFQDLENRRTSKVLLKVLSLMTIIGFIFLFLPWTQNIRTKGYVSTLNPFDKPQNVQSLISGQLEEWYVQEGQIVQAGDTIAKIAEAKEDYLDPDIVSNTELMQQAKMNSMAQYSDKVVQLNDQIRALEQNFQSKRAQLQIKRDQLDLKVATDSLGLAAANTYVDNATNQLDRMQQMFDKGLKSLNDLEGKRLSLREALAKQLSISNKLMQYQNESLNLDQQAIFIASDYQQKRSKIESEKRSANSDRFNAQGETSKIQSKLNQLKARQSAYYITSPINGTITKILKNGIGEFVKQQESLATIVPQEYQKAVELYVTPNDMPLIRKGKKVRLQFDGWPAVVFSGWPDNSFGTFGGEVFAIDNDISENGKYRILVIEDDSEKKWPDLVRIGSGARGLLLLNDVKIYYELWRQLNGFPPDFYEPQENKEVKTKAPIKKVK